MAPGPYVILASMSSETGTPRLGILLAMAMFVFVIDTSLMNVSISAVVRDLDTTVSGVQSAVALEALVSAAFILIGSKVGDLIGRKVGLFRFGVVVARPPPLVQTSSFVDCARTRAVCHSCPKQEE